MTAGAPAAISSHIKAGKMRPIASWGNKRQETYPEVPTFKELGYDIEYRSSGSVCLRRKARPSQ